MQLPIWIDFDELQETMHFRATLNANESSFDELFQLERLDVKQIKLDCVTSFNGNGFRLLHRLLSKSFVEHRPVLAKYRCVHMVTLGNQVSVFRLKVELIG